MVPGDPGGVAMFRFLVLLSLSAALAGCVTTGSEIVQEGQSTVILHSSLQEMGCFGITMSLTQKDVTGRWVPLKTMDLKVLYENTLTPSQVVLAPASTASRAWAARRRSVGLRRTFWTGPHSGTGTGRSSSTSRSRYSGYCPTRSSISEACSCGRALPVTRRAEDGMCLPPMSCRSPSRLLKRSAEGPGALQAPRGASDEDRRQYLRLARAGPGLRFASSGATVAHAAHPRCLPRPRPHRPARPRALPLRPARRRDLSRRQFAWVPAEGRRGARRENDRAGVGHRADPLMERGGMVRVARAHRRKTCTTARRSAASGHRHRHDLGQSVQAAGRGGADAARSQDDPRRARQFSLRQPHRRERRAHDGAQRPLRAGLGDRRRDR